MKILLTGGTGSVGRHAVKHLVSKGHSVRVIGRSENITLDGAEYTSCDVTDFDILRDLAGGMDAIVHLAAARNPYDYPTQDIFRINCQGTYNIFAAAAAAGIKRVVCASSINALGYTFGIEGFSAKYFPIDENHPTYTTDPYSFSKQIMEQTAAYFWRREKITSVCLRLPAVYEEYQIEKGWLLILAYHFKKAFNTLLDLPSHERALQIQQLIKIDSEIRRERNSLPLEKMHILWGRPDSDHPTEEDRANREKLRKQWIEETKKRLNCDQRLPIFPLMNNRTDFWSAITAQDSALAIEKSLSASYEGSHPLFVTDRCNMLGIDTELLISTMFPDVTKRTRPLSGTESLVSIDRARTLIGFEPEYSMEESICKALKDPPSN